MKERTWLSILLSYAGPCRGKMAASVALAVVSVAGGFVPYLGVYQILRLFVERRAGLEGILLWCGVCLAGYTVKVAGYALSTMLAHVSAYTILEGLRLQVADRLMGAPLGEVESRPIGAMKSTVVDRIEDVEPPLAHMIPELSSNLLLPLAVVIAMFAIDWRMGLALLVTIPVALVPMAAGMRSYNKNYAAYMAANNHVNSVIVEYVEGIQVVKAFSQGERSYAKFAQAVSSFRDFTLNWFRCTWASMNLCLSILPTTLLGTLPVGVYLYQTGVLDPAQVTLCLMMALGIVSPLMSATAFINSMKSMQFAVKDTRELLDLPQLSQAKQEADLDGSGIRFRNVSFSYGGTGGAEVLHDLELHIPQGSFTALVGPSGGGKSTIARLAARFWDVTAGSITLGGRDIREMPLKQLSQAISFVTQDNFLFDCSLKENIRLGKPDASDEEVLAAARAAQCEEFLARLDRGWDTPAGEAGKQLSGGERQRIAIARAILKDAPIVILDEATAFTDPENEDKIQSSIMALSKGKTLLVIAHRLSTIQNADQIVVLEKGHIVDQGTQAELLRRCPLYQKLWQAHIGAQGWAVTSGAKEGQ
ncbi:MULTISPECIES: ABC transporter ATP-binding protein [Oscillospiraceae]|uniref:ABC transporter ATP-binding protein n=1 Tax=Oscillospiraceae TaxID=216572 RepID=UPI000E658051